VKDWKGWPIGVVSGADDAAAIGEMCKKDLEIGSLTLKTWVCGTSNNACEYVNRECG